MDKIQILAVVLFKRKKVRIIRIIESISKSVNSAKPSIVMASSNETSIADENDFKTVVDLCKYFNYLSYIFQEETPICNLTILNPLHII